jgi:polyferredoxin
MLRKIRILLAALFFALITLLFLDFTGTLHTWFGWMAKIQFMPAVLALNGVIIGFLVLLTLLLGRVYCSIICPLGVFQDIVARTGKRGKKLPYTFSTAKSWIRYSVLLLFVVAIIGGLSVIVSLLDPYGAYGRIANNLFLPVWQWGNNLLAMIAERVDSYAFYTTGIWMKSLPTIVIAVITLGVVTILAWRNGRTYCNTTCPVGTFLGFLARFSVFQVRIDKQKCNKCAICERNCKAACIDSKEFKVDHSRCVSCMNCITKCNRDAVGYTFKKERKGENGEIGNRRGEPACSPIESREAGQGRKEFLTATILLTASALKAQIVPIATDIKMDGGLADILEKKSPERQTSLTPAGSSSARNMKKRCTACQLCITVCSNNVLYPSSSIETFMQPFMSFERGYCRPECVKCSEVCPTGAICKISKEEKSSTQIGHAVWVRERCIPLTDEQECYNCERHCPTKAITMIPSVAGDEKSLQIPAVNEELCIGCGACEYLCPSRPLSAIYVEGHPIHKII